MKNKKLMLLLSLVFAMVIALTACGKKNEPANNANAANNTEANANANANANAANDANAEATDADEQVAVTLADWEGTWNNMGGYLDEPELQSAFEKLAEKDNTSAEEAKSAYVAKRQCDFDGLVIEGNKAIFLDGFQDKDGKEIESVEYEYADTHKTMHGNYELEWHVFKAAGDAKYPVLLMMPVHGEEGLTHFHMRYGDDEKALLEKEDWFPTFVKPNATTDQIAEEIAE